MSAKYQIFQQFIKTKRVVLQLMFIEKFIKKPFVDIKLDLEQRSIFYSIFFPAQSMASLTKIV